MAVALDASQDVTGSGGVSSLTVSSFTVANNSDRYLMLIGGTSASGGGQAFSTWAWGADSMTERHDNVVANDRVGFADLVAPAAETRNATVTFAAATDEAYACAVSLYNVDQTTPRGTIRTNSTLTGTQAWVSCDGITDGMSVGMAYLDGTSIGTLASVNGAPEVMNTPGTAAQSAAATSLAPAAPTARLLGSLEFCSVATENNATINVNGAWSQAGTTRTQDSTWQQALFYRIYNGTNVDPAPSWSGSVGCSARRWIAHDAHHSSPIGTVSTNAGTSSTHTITGQNSTANNSTQMYVDHAEANTALGADAGYSETFDAGSSTGPYRLVVGQREQLTSGAGADNFSATGAAASWVMRLTELLAGTPQTLRQQGDQIGTFISAGVATEPGATYNMFGFTAANVATFNSFAVSIQPSSGAANFDATGDLDAQSSTVSGTATSDTVASSTLSAQAASASGAATVSRASSGALAAQSSAVSGTATVSRASTGALAAQAATIDGDAEVDGGAVDREATGDLDAQASAVSGAGTVSRASSGALAAQAASVAGSATVSRASSGTLAAQASTVVGVARLSRAASAALEAQAASLAGSATQSGTPELPDSPAYRPVLTPPEDNDFEIFARVAEIEQELSDLAEVIDNLREDGGYANPFELDIE